MNLIILGWTFKGTKCIFVKRREETHYFFGFLNPHTTITYPSIHSSIYPYRSPFSSIQLITSLSTSPPLPYFYQIYLFPFYVTFIFFLCPQAISKSQPHGCINLCEAWSASPLALARPGGHKSQNLPGKQTRC